MGFSPLEGVPMATRSGTVDPEAVLHLLRHDRATVEEIGDALERESGLLGLSGTTARVEELQASQEPDARLALDVFTYRLACAVAASAVSLGGLDALVFTAGVGERSPSTRAAVCERLRFLGVELDAAANESPGPQGDLASAGSAVRVVVVQAREDVIAARAARRLLAAG
jgi:acetate kinase